MDDDALDDQPEDSLAITNVDGVQPGSDAFAECAKARQHFARLEPFGVQPEVLLVLLLGQAALLGERPPMTGQLLEADHLGLVGFEQAAVGPLQPLQARAQLTRGAILVPGFCSLRQEALELRDKPRRITEQAGHVRPDRLLDRRGLDSRSWASRLTRRGERVGPSASVVAPAGPPTVAGEIATVNAETATAALEQAAQHVVMLRVAPDESSPLRVSTAQTPSQA